MNDPGKTIYESHVPATTGNSSSDKDPKKARKAEKQAMRAHAEDVLKKLSPRDVALASFPRSGSTWVRGCLIDLHRQMKGEITAPTARVGIGRTLPSLNNADMRKWGEYCPGVRMYKTHTMTQIQGRRFIYLVRDPADCLRSFYRYSTRGEFDKVLALDDFVNRQLMRWCDHVNRAITLHSQSPEKSVFLAYRNMHAEPARELFRVMSFLSLSPSLAMVERAIGNNLLEIRKMLASEKKRQAPTITWVRGRWAWARNCRGLCE